MSDNCLPSGECKKCGESITFSDGAWRHDSTGKALKDGHYAAKKY